MELLKLNNKCITTDDHIKITDPESGEECCKVCGQVLSGVILNDSYSSLNSSGNNNSQHYPVNYKMGEKKLGSQISKNGIASKKLNYSQKFVYRDINNIKGLLEFNKISDKLHLPEFVVNEAISIYIKMRKKGSLRGREMRSGVAACLYLSAKKNNLNLTIKDICDKTGLNNSVIYSFYSNIMVKLKISSSDLNVLLPESYMEKLFSKLDLGLNSKRKSIAIVKDFQMKELHVGKNPIGIAAASIYIACEVSVHNVTQDMLANISGVSAITIRRSIMKYMEYNQ